MMTVPKCPKTAEPPVGPRHTAFRRNERGPSVRATANRRWTTRTGTSASGTTSIVQPAINLHLMRCEPRCSTGCWAPQGGSSTAQARLLTSLQSPTWQGCCARSGTPPPRWPSTSVSAIAGCARRARRLARSDRPRTGLLMHQADRLARRIPAPSLSSDHRHRARLTPLGIRRCCCRVRQGLVHDI